MTVREQGSQGAPWASGLFDAYRGELVTLAWLTLGDRDLAEDVVQTAFVKIHDRDPSEIANERAYLRAVVVNECRQQMRRRARTVPLDEVARDLCVEDPEMSHFVELISGLSPKRRLVLSLRFYLDMRVDDIAEVLRCRPSTVSSLIHRGLAQLREEQ